jgi:hypothetical protein
MDWRRETYLVTLPLISSMRLPFRGGSPMSKGLTLSAAVRANPAPEPKGSVKTGLSCWPPRPAPDFLRPKGDKLKELPLRWLLESPGLGTELSLDCCRRSAVDVPVRKVDKLRKRPLFLHWTGVLPCRDGTPRSPGLTLSAAVGADPAFGAKGSVKTISSLAFGADGGE